MAHRIPPFEQFPQAGVLQIIYLPNAVLPHLPQNLKKLHAPPSGLKPTLTIKSEAMADLRAELNTEKSFEEAALRLHGAVVCRRGVEHQRLGSACEDVPYCGEAGRDQVCPCHLNGLSEAY